MWVISTRRCDQYYAPGTLRSVEFLLQCVIVVQSDDPDGLVSFCTARCRAESTSPPREDDVQ
jgi:hypothetical protein